MIERTITIDGSTYKLKYPNSVVRKIDRKLGYSAMHIVEKVQKHGSLAPLSLDDIGTVLWGGLLHKQPGLQVDQVVDKIPIRPLEKYSKVAETVFNIIMDIYGMDGEAEARERDEGNSPAGRGSGTGEKSSA